MGCEQPLLPEERVNAGVMCFTESVGGFSARQ